MLLFTVASDLFVLICKILTVNCVLKIIYDLRIPIQANAYAHSNQSITFADHVDTRTKILAYAQNWLQSLPWACLVVSLEYWLGQDMINMIRLMMTKVNLVI